MTDARVPRPLRRPAYHPGQLLTASDLGNATTYDRQMRTLHNRGLHDWGIVFGFGVQGQRGSRSVQVSPGLALDCLGNEIVLAEAREIPIRTEASGELKMYVLTARWREDEQLTAVNRHGPCGASGAVHRIEECEIAWRDPDEVHPASRFRPGIDIPLAAATVGNCKLDKNVALEVRRDAKPATHPNVFAGLTPAGATEWRWWPDALSRRGVAATVATNRAGFDQTPVYQLQLMGSRILDGNPIDGLITATEPTSQSVDAVVLLPEVNTGWPRLNRAAVVRAEGFVDQVREVLQWHIAWIGVEG